LRDGRGYGQALAPRAGDPGGRLRACGLAQVDFATGAERCANVDGGDGRAAKGAARRFGVKLPKLVLVRVGPDLRR
jgi:hypothetical protein